MFGVQYSGRYGSLASHILLLFGFCNLQPATCTSSAHAAEPREVGWRDLVVHVEFEDPFEDLSGGQLMKLSIYARVRTLEEHKPESVSEGMAKEAEEAAAWLKEQGVDIEGLLARREEIKELRKQRASATNGELNGTAIRMPGYALPLEYEGKAVTEFLLVPWVGACIHTPPPPPNQIVHVTTSDPFEARNRFEPVMIEGAMKIGGVQKSLYLVDGSADIDIGYSMSDAEVERYKAAPPSD